MLSIDLNACVTERGEELAIPDDLETGARPSTRLIEKGGYYPRHRQRKDKERMLRKELNKA